jgi:hypothetical protein
LRVAPYGIGEQSEAGAPRSSAFGYQHPNYDSKALAQVVCRQKGWLLMEHRFYTGIPSPADDLFWHRFWAAKLLAMSRSGTHVFSQDQDLSEVADEIRVIAREQNRWIAIASAFPASPSVRNKRGTDKTDWIKIDRRTCDSCLDHRDYRGP